MVEFYHYVIYRLYVWRLNNSDNTPGATVIFLLVAVHFAQILLGFAVLAKFFPVFTEVFKQQKIIIIIAYIAISILYAALIYNKKRWLQYVEDFRNETPSERKKRGILVWLFTAGSIILLFILVPLLFWNYKS